MMRHVFRALFPLMLVTAVFVTVLHSRKAPWRRTLPQESFRADHCTWYCHNRGCRHTPLLPGWLTSDAGAFGITIDGLYVLGRLISRDRAIGYGVANLLVFCVGWPVTTYGLWFLALHQKKKLSQMRMQLREKRRT